jgi:phosphatidylserine synthase
VRKACLLVREIMFDKYFVICYLLFVIVTVLRVNRFNRRQNTATKSSTNTIKTLPITIAIKQNSNFILFCNHII